MSELRPSRHGGLDQHFWLTRSMARVIGVNLTDAMAEGRSSGDTYAEMVAHCRSCPHVTTCVEWLSKSNGSAPAPPAFCLIGARLSALQR